jgi:N-methylhydantoinase B
MFSFFGGGHGGNPEGDGLSHGNPPIATAIIPPVEIMEAAYPIRFTQWALRPGSGGAGTHRGGLGAIYEIELRDGAAEAFVFAERARFAPRGVLGGGEGARNLVAFEQADGWHTPPLGSKIVGVKLARGQRVRLESPGGGGWGDPAGRDPAAAARDARLGYTT